MKDCLPWMRPHDGTGKEYEEEGAAETNHYALRATDLIPHPTALLEGEKVGSEAEPGKKRGVGGKWFFFRFVLISY